MDRGAWRATTHGLTKSQTRLNVHHIMIWWFSLILYAGIMFFKLKLSDLLSVQNSSHKPYSCLLHFWILALWPEMGYLYFPSFSSLEKAMASQSSTLAWKIPWIEESGRLQSMGSRRVGHDWATSLSLFTFMNWRRKWQPTPVFLPGESQGRGSLVGCRLWGRTESDTTEAT